MDTITTYATKTNIAVALFDRHPQVEVAVRALQRAGYYMRKISIIGKACENRDGVVGFLSTGYRSRIFGRHGALWSGWMGVLVGSAMMFVPLVGHVVVLGPLASTLLRGIQGVVAEDGVSPLAVAWMATGISEDSVLRYQAALEAGKFVLAVHGDAEEVERAYRLLDGSGFSSFDRHGSEAEMRHMVHDDRQRFESRPVS